MSSLTNVPRAQKLQGVKIYILWYTIFYEKKTKIWPDFHIGISIPFKEPLQGQFTNAKFLQLTHKDRCWM